MAVNERLMPVSPERVFSVLTDAKAYGDWVVGSDTVRDQDPGWPAPGTRFHHRVGVGPFKLADHSEVVEIDPPNRLVLEVKARPLLTAVVTLALERRGGGTLVRMEERAGDLPSRLVFNPFTQPLLKLRNTEALRRLERLATRPVTAR